MTVVVGVDGSPPSRTTLRLAAQEARCRQVPLVAVSASECPVMLVPSGGPASQPADQPKGEAPR